MSFSKKLILIFVFLPAFSFAQEVSTSTPVKPVTFTVNVGTLKCDNGKGTALVTFANDPEAGGYYEVYGKPITENDIMLERKVSLPTGSYTWKGDLNDGYYVVGASSGAFSVGACKTAVPTPTQVKATIIKTAITEPAAPKKDVTPATIVTPAKESAVPSADYGIKFWASVILITAIIFLLWNNKASGKIT